MVNLFSTDGRLDKGLLFAFEGVDGSGKSTQARLLAQALRDRGYPVVLTREPTDGPYGTRIRSLFHDRGSVTLAEELELFLADRRDHVATVINPALQSRAIVITDRYFLSTAAYQGVRGGDWQAILAANEAFAPLPDRMFFLQMDSLLGLERIRTLRHEQPNDFEEEANLAKVALIYHAVIRDYLCSVDGNRPIEVVHAEILRYALETITALTM